MEIRRLKSARWWTRGWTLQEPLAPDVCSLLLLPVARVPRQSLSSTACCRDHRNQRGHAVSHRRRGARGSGPCQHRIAHVVGSAPRDHLRQGHGVQPAERSRRQDTTPIRRGWPRGFLSVAGGDHGIIARSGCAFIFHIASSSKNKGLSNFVLVLELQQSTKQEEDFNQHATPESTFQSEPPIAPPKKQPSTLSHLRKRVFGVIDHG